MKIDFTTLNKTILQEGIHEVTITYVSVGANPKTGNKFFKCIFSNCKGYLPQWFYVTERSKSFIKKLFIASGVLDDIAEVKDLLSKSLLIRVKNSFLINPSTGEITKEISTCIDFEPNASLKAA